MSFAYQVFGVLGGQSGCAAKSAGNPAAGGESGATQKGT